MICKCREVLTLTRLPMPARLIRRICLMLCLALASYTGLAADASKVLHVLMKKSESGFDPALASDFNSLCVIENIFDSMLRYDYLARPLTLQPNTLSRMPTVSNDGKEYVFHIQPGIYFSDDSAWKGSQRELTASDYAYSIKRLYDPRLHSPWLFLFKGHLAGDHTLLAAAEAGRFDVDQPIAGVKLADRYTLILRLNAPDRNFLFKLAMPATGAVAREVMDAHADATGTHPVGTGPYRLQSWQRSERIVLDANPGFREVRFKAQGFDDSARAAIAKRLDGQRLPLIGRIELRVIEEQETAVLGFLKHQFDLIEQVPPPVSGLLIEHGSLKPALRESGIGVRLFPVLQTYYMWMNMDDPVIGGYTPERVALRRAIAMAYHREEDIRVLERGLAQAAQSPLPPNLLGYDPDYRNPVPYDPALAKRLLDWFGYRVRDGSGFRSQPDGRPLTLTMHAEASTAGYLRAESWRRALTAIGIRIVFHTDSYTEILRAARLGKVQMFEADWLADYPDAENFYQLLYGPNRDRSNYAHFALPAFDQRFLRIQNLPDGPERQRLLDEMADIVNAYNPWVLRYHTLSLDVWHPWLRNYLRHPVELTGWRYWDIDHDTRPHE